MPIFRDEEISDLPSVRCGKEGRFQDIGRR
jgi:hypothetical protein